MQKKGSVMSEGIAYYFLIFIIAMLVVADLDFASIDRYNIATGHATQCETCAEKTLPDNYLNDITSAAKEYLASHPEIADRASYGDLEAAAQLRDGTIAILMGKGFNAETVPDPTNPSVSCPQMISIWKTGDPEKKSYRLTASGGIIKEAILAETFDIKENQKTLPSQGCVP